MSTRDLDDTFVQFGNFVEAVAPPHQRFQAVLLPTGTDTRTPVIQVPAVTRGMYGLKPYHLNRGAFVVDRLPANMVLECIGTVVSVFDGDDTAATLDNYSTSF